MLSKAVPDTWIQALAKEIGLSETAFVLRKKDGFSLRWFTPSVEVNLCGHATLASAQALWESGHVQQEDGIRFHSKSGVLTAEKKEDYIYLDFPSFEVSPLKTIPEDLIEALGVEPCYLGEGQNALLLEVDSERTRRSIRPNFERLLKVPYGGIIVTSLSENGSYDFVSRYFGPREGINEDPVTGFAHCHLGPYWKSKLNKRDLCGYQASRRGGIVKTRVGDDDRVHLGGKAIIVMRGEISSSTLSENTLNL